MFFSLRKAHLLGNFLRSALRVITCFFFFFYFVKSLYNLSTEVFKFDLFYVGRQSACRGQRSACRRSALCAVGPGGGTGIAKLSDKGLICWAIASACIFIIDDFSKFVCPLLLWLPTPTRSAIPAEDLGCFRTAWHGCLGPLWSLQFLLSTAESSIGHYLSFDNFCFSRPALSFGL